MSFPHLGRRRCAPSSPRHLEDGAEVSHESGTDPSISTERAALRWIQTNVHFFGGDKTKVTIFGESAGAISVALQMVSNGGNTEGLFRAAFCLSGAPIPVGSILHGQSEFDFVSKAVGCTGANKTLACMRLVPYQSKSSSPTSERVLLTFCSQP